MTKKLYDLRKRNWAWHEILGNFLVQGIEFDPLGVAREWRPKKNTFPHVLVNPKIAFGQPVLAESGIPTQALRDAFDAERELESVSDWYQVPKERVEEAILFEAELAAA